AHGGTRTMSTLSIRNSTVTRYYRVLVAGSVNTLPTGNICYISPSDTVKRFDPQVVSAPTPVSRCGPGSVILTATGNSGSIMKWYRNSTGGDTLATGNSFTVTIIDDSTYYVAAASGAVST